MVETKRKPAKVPVKKKPKKRPVVKHLRSAEDIFGVRFLKSGLIMALDQKYTGDEPDWENADDMTREEYMSSRNRALGFYAYYGNSKLFRQWLVEWMAKGNWSEDDIAFVKGASPYLFPGTLGKLARMLSLGMPETPPCKTGLDVEDEEDVRTVSRVIEQELKSVLFKFEIEKSRMLELPEELKEKPAKKLTVEEKWNKVVNNEIIAVLEGWIDDITEIDVDKNIVPLFDVARLVEQHRIPPAYRGPIIEWLERYQREFDLVLEYHRNRRKLEDKDPSTLSGREDEMVQYAEGWEYLKRVHINKLEKETARNIKSVRELKIAAPVRAASTGKPKAAATAPKQVTTVKVLKEHEGLKSLPPVKVPFKRHIYLWRPDTRTLIVVKSKSASGVTVRGLGIFEFDEKKTIRVTVRANKVDHILKVIAETNSPGEIDAEILNLIPSTKRKDMSSLQIKPRFVSEKIIILKALK